MEGDFTGPELLESQPTEEPAATLEDGEVVNWNGKSSTESRRRQRASSGQHKSLPPLKIGRPLERSLASADTDSTWFAEEVFERFPSKES